MADPRANADYIHGPRFGKDSAGAAYLTTLARTNRRECANVAVTTTGSDANAIDLDSYFGTNKWRGRWLRMLCDQDFEFGFSESNSITSLVKAATNGTEGCLVKANVAESFVRSGRYLYIDAASAGTINLAL